MRFFENLNLSKKAALVVISMLLAASASYYFLNSQILLKSYINIENAAAQKDTGRGVDALKIVISELDNKTGDWANWDDAYSYVQKPSPEFIKVNATDTTFTQININLIVFINKTGQIIYIKAFNLEDKTEIAVDKELKDALLTYKQIVFHDAIASNVDGIILLPKGPMLIASRPILTSDGKGPIAGSLIFGRYLDKKLISELSQTTNLNLSFLSASGKIDTDLAGIQDTLVKNNAYLTKALSENSLAGYALIKDVQGSPALILKVDLPRNIFQQGKMTIWYFTLSISLFTFVFGLIIIIFLQRLILSRVSFIAKKAVEIGQSGDVSQKINLSGKDEIAVLAAEINKMLGTIDTSEMNLKREKEGVEAKVVERTGQLAEETARLQSSISNLNVGFVITTVDKNIFLMNAAAKKIVGSESAGMTDIVKKFKGGVDITAQMSDCMTKKHTYEIKSLQVENEYFHIFISPITIYKKNAQKVIGTVMFIEDVTEAKLLERTRDEFFSIASHELRTPITAIKGNTALIQQYYFDKFKDKDLKDMILDIHASSARLIEIVNDFLDVSRLEQGRIEYKKQATDIGGIIDTVIKELQPPDAEKNVKAVFKKGSLPLPSVAADPDKLKQVLINLIGNAFKFTEKGMITVSAVIKPEGFVKILIADAGRGIPSANQNLLFRKFQQAGSSILTRDTTKGTGLGLYISKLMVEGMGGKIQLESSAEGKGSTFSFLLPVATPKNIGQKDQSSIDIKTGLTQKSQT